MVSNGGPPAFSAESHCQSLGGDNSESRNNNSGNTNSANDVNVMQQKHSGNLNQNQAASVERPSLNLQAASYQPGNVVGSLKTALAFPGNSSGDNSSSGQAT